MANSIHSAAFIAPSARIGNNVTIGPCAYIEDDVVIGDDCIIDAFASVKQYTTLGKGNHIHSYAMVGGEPQDLKFHGEKSELIIGDNNNIREFATLHRGTEAGSLVTKIGNNNLIMAYCHIAHDCQLGNNIVMSNNATLAGHCIVDDFAILGGLSAVPALAPMHLWAELPAFLRICPRICWLWETVQLSIPLISWACAACAPVRNCSPP